MQKFFILNFFRKFGPPSQKKKLKIYLIKDILTLFLKNFQL